MMTKMADKYFFYSRQQMTFKKELNAKIGKRFRVGWVIVNGTKLNVTEINTTGKSRFPDAKLVASGDPTKMTYSRPGTY